MAIIAEIWIINDAKPGHANQSLGLAEAIQAIRPELVLCQRPPGSVKELLVTACRKRGPSPQLIIGAGHRTHLTLLALKRATAAPVVVMMSPSFPLSWFDLCIIPAHDEPPQRDNVVVTLGAVNRINPPGEDTKKSLNMILVGGPSEHYHWNADTLLEQILSVAGGGGDWLLATSRRTPNDFMTALNAIMPGNVAVAPFEQVPQGWLANNLPLAKLCWVTPDSVSMVYEALTAGSAVGVFELPAKGSGRVVAGLERLKNQGQVTGYPAWQAGEVLHPEKGFNEAARCARIVCDRLLGGEAGPL